MLIEVDIRSYWRAGTGGGEVGGIDALCAVDHDGLPYLPGKHLKGLLRDALNQAISFGHVNPEATKVLFGERGFENSAGDLIPFSRAGKGCLRVDSAHLSAADRWTIIGAAERDKLIPQLFRTIQSTAIDENSGAAKAESLRLEQVAVPLRLEFEVTGPSGDWEQSLKAALPLIRAVGQKRTRGLGRAVLRCRS